MEWPSWKAPIWMVLGHFEFDQTNQNFLRRKRRSYSQSLVENYWKEAQKRTQWKRNDFFPALLFSKVSTHFCMAPICLFLCGQSFFPLPCNYDQWSIHRVPSQSGWWRGSSFIPLQHSCRLSWGVSSGQQWRCMTRSVRKPPQQPITALPPQLCLANAVCWKTRSELRNNNRKECWNTHRFTSWEKMKKKINIKEVEEE